jgi:hypothetical protein
VKLFFSKTFQRSGRRRILNGGRKNPGIEPLMADLNRWQRGMGMWRNIGI